MRAGCFTLIGCLMSCGGWHSVALPHSVVGSSAVCDCGISGSHSLTLWGIIYLYVRSY